MGERVRRSWTGGRITAALLLWLMIGAAMTVVTTWALAIMPWTGRVPGDGSDVKLPAREIERWPMRLPKGSEQIDFNGTRVYEKSRRGLTWFDGTMWLPGAGWGSGVEAYLYGFPFRSMAYVFVWSLDSPLDPASPYLSPVTYRWGTRTVMVPLHPIFPGFALNTLIYAGLAWGLWQLPFAARRWRRKRRNQCPACGYSRAGLAEGAACPECGFAPDPPALG